MEYTIIINYVAAIVWGHQQRDYEPPDISHFSVKQAIGVQRSRMELPHKRDPVTVETLLLMYQSLSAVPKNMRITFWAACLTAFYTLLRSANLFHQPAAKVQRCVRYCDVQVFRDRIAFKVQVLKTTRFSGNNIILYAPLILHNKALCPATAILALLNEAGHSSSDPLFGYRENHKISPMTGQLFNTLLKRKLTTAGISPERYSAHSFRRGGATFSAKVEIPEKCIQVQGNWRSDCFRRYIEQDNELRHQYSNRIANCIPQQ